jgi:xylulokinase
MTMERPLWAEQRPENWWDVVQFAIRSVLKQSGVTGKEVRGVGLTGQMHGLVLLDGGGHVLRRSLIWCDQRSQPQVDAINQKIGREDVVAFTANPVLTGFTLPKLLWVRDNEPAIFDKTRHVLLPKDYVRHRLTGEYATDVSDASGTGVFDVVTRQWSGKMLERLGLDAALLPAAVESTAQTGSISKKAAEATGLEPGTPVFGGAGDQAASAIGNGITKPGIASCTLGTSGVVFAHMERPNYDPTGRVHTFCHAVPGKWHVMGVTQGAGLSLEWFRNQFATETDFGVLMDEAAIVLPGANGLFWLPYLMGERTPHLDANARGGWIGITAKHTRADLIRALIEGVSYSQKDCLSIIEGLGVKVDSVRASGGGGQSPLWRQILADVFGKRVAALKTQEGSAYGAALLATVGTAAFASVEEASNAALEEVSVSEPRPRESKVYASGYEVYQALYPSLRPLYSLIEGLH